MNTPIEKMFFAYKPHVYHWARDGETLCKLPTIMMQRIRAGQTGDELPECLNCQRILIKIETPEAEP